MLSRSLRTACSNKGSKAFLLGKSYPTSSASRLLSTATTDAKQEKPKNVLKFKRATSENTKSEVSGQRVKGDFQNKNQFVSTLYDSLDADYTEFSPLFEKVQHAFQKASPRDKGRSFFSMIPLGNALLTRVLDIKKRTNNDVPTSILFKEIISLLIENKLIHVSHFNRYIRELIAEKKYLNALTIWIENVNYFKDTPQAFVSKINNSGISKEYNLLGLSLYLLSLIENNEKKVDPEFIKLIFGEKPSCSLSNFQYFVDGLTLPSEDAQTIVSLYSTYTTDLFDINSSESLKGIRVASVDGKVVHLENTINKNLLAYKGRETQIKPSTIAHYMEYSNNCKLYSRSIELWKFASLNKIELTVDIWNQLLSSFASSAISDSRNKVESVWKLLNDSVKPNSQSYSVYVKYLLKNKEIGRVEEIVNDLKKNQPKLFDNSLKCAMIEFLLLSDKTNESLQLFKIYQQSESFVPTIEIYNKLLSKLIAEKKFEAAQKLLDELMSKKYENISPDIATWTTIIDFLLKTSARSNLTKDEILDKILSIIKTMEAHNIKFNSVALITVANNLLRNRQTSDLGFSILQSMELSNVKLNAVGYSGIITAFTDVGDMTNSLYYYDKALKNGIKPTAFLYNSILKGYSRSPNIPETRKFMEGIKALTEANPHNMKMLPNKYTFYYLLSQGVALKDRDFVHDILKELSETNTELGSSLPTILKSLKESGYNIPESLAQKIQ
ncbi:hypothetical protein PMKS-002204 [Pichia membranifaciens]|uniref:Mitochondrial 15S rRNA processing factor CCM1 n=1 Tax=Pichia membranifaciens TaxID=4926 RepID=A0A1Q2YGQ7_9ASCO|nr:hypothetical protein PMKS-002204 [Pichia membranifaciens]